MINNSEDQLTFVQFLRWIADGVLDDPAEGVKAYHGALAKLSIKPMRPLADDLQATKRSAAYSGRTVVAVPAGATTTKSSCSDCKCGGECCTSKGDVLPKPNTPAERIARNRAKWDRILG